MKVLFIVPKTFASYPGATVPHVGIAYLCAILKKNGFSVKVLDMGFGYSHKILFKEIDNFDPALIGITAYSYNFDKTSNLISTIKEVTDVPIVIGGSHVSAFKSDVFRQADVDFAIKREGEYPLVKLCKTLFTNSKSSFASIDGLIWKNGNSIVENQENTFLENLDLLPFPDYDSFDLNKYIFSMDCRIPIVTSRGCPYACNYCSVKLSMGRKFRARTPENVFDEIQTLYNCGWRYFDIVDDCFSQDIDRAIKICDLIIKRNLKIQWSLGNGVRADRVNEILLSKMNKAGCVFLSYGLESGDDNVLKIIKKGINTRKALDTFNLTKKIGIPFAVNFILGHPGENLESAMQTLSFAKSLPASYVNVYNLIPYPNTELFDWVERNGKFLVDKKSYLNSIATRVKKPIFETSQFSRKEREKALKYGFSVAKKSNLEFRLGKKVSSLIYPFIILDKLYYLGRKFVFGFKLGRRLYNKIRLQ